MLVDAATFTNSLPHSIIGFFFWPQHSITSGVAERRMHARFLEHFGLDENTVPWMRFVDASEHGMESTAFTLDANSDVAFES